MADEANESSTRSTLRRRRIRGAVVIALVVVVGVPLGYYGWQRGWRTNFGVVVPGRVYRSAQPDAGQIRRWAGRYAIRTIINLRGRQSEPFDAANRAAAEECGVTIVDIKVSSRNLPRRKDVETLIHTLDRSDRAILIHCRDGADRSGVAGVLAAMAVGHEDYRTARGELSLRYFHLYDRPNGLTDLLTQYEQYCRDRSLDTDGWTQFRTWALDEYAGRNPGTAE